MIIINDLKIKVIAKMVHEANKVFCEAQGDNSQEHWNEAPDYNHTSAMEGIRAVFLNPNITAAELHNVWVAQKEKDGWKYGEVKDRDKKTHPSMVPYGELSAVEQYKDYIVIDMTKSYINFLNQPYEVI